MGAVLSGGPRLPTAIIGHSVRDVCRIPGGRRDRDAHAQGEAALDASVTTPPPHRLVRAVDVEAAVVDRVGACWPNGGISASTGPVYRLAMDRRIPVQTFVEIYRPLWWLESRIPGLDKIMDWYLQQYIKS